MDGSTGVSPSTSIDWSYSVPPLDAQQERVEVSLVTQNVSIESDELPDNSLTTWTPPDPLAPGGWVAQVENAIDIRNVPDGLVITGDSWALENSDWLALESVDRAGFTVAGSGLDDPLLPIDTGDGFLFEFGIVDITETAFIDPMVAIGYDYIVDWGPNFASVLPPTGIGDNLYDLWLFDTLLSEFVDSGIDLIGGIVHDFELGGVDRFRILGIETTAGLDPNDVLAFVTGLTFVDTGTVQMRMIPITTDTDGETVPEPNIFVLLSCGLISLGFLKRGSKKNDSLADRETGGF